MLGFRIVPLLVTITIYKIGYRALLQKDILEPLEVNESKDKKLTSKKSIDDKILRYMEDKKPFLNADITLPQLAEELGYTRNQLSEIINKGTGKNFFDFINSYRVQVVKEDLKNPLKDHYTIIAIAFDAGFNSKATFNKAFKSIVGITPSQYKKTR